MAKKSLSAKRSLKVLFSKSEANLKESEDDNSKSTSLKFFKWKKKTKDATDRPEERPMIARTEPATLGVSESRIGEEGSGHKLSLFSSAPKSKKAPLSYSETDLRKPRRFGTFTLNWKKKKEDLSKSLSSVSEDPRVKGHISEQDEFEDQVEIQQTVPHIAGLVSTAPPLTISNQLQAQHVLSDMSLANKEDRLEVTKGFMPAHLESELIPYIDSDSDGYQTPPESPAADNLPSDYPAAQIKTRVYLTYSETYIPENSSTFSSHHTRYSQMDSLEPGTATDALHTAELFSRNNGIVEPAFPAVDRSQYSKSWSCASETKDDIIDSVNLVSNVKTASRPYTHYVDSSRPEAHLNQNGVSSRNGHSLLNYDSERSKSRISADVPVKTFTADIASKADTMVPQDFSKDIRFIIPENTSSSAYQNSVTFTHQNSTSSVPQRSQSSSSSVHENSSFSIPQSFTSSKYGGFTSNSNTSQISTSYSDSVITLPKHSSSNPANIITTETEDFEFSTTDNTVVSVTRSYMPVNNTGPHHVTADTSQPISVSFMPDVITSSTVSSKYVDGDTDTKPVSSSYNSDVSQAERDLSPIYKDLCNSLMPQSFPTTTVHSTSHLHRLEKSHPDFGSETISMESPQADFNLTCAADSGEPCPAVAGPVHRTSEPVLHEDESTISSPESVSSEIHTIINSTKTDTFDLSGSSDSITSDPDPFWRGLSHNKSYLNMVTQSEKQDHIRKEMDHDKSSSSETINASSGSVDHGISRTLISEGVSAIVIHPPSHSHELFSSLARKAEIYQRTVKAYEGLNTEETRCKKSAKIFETSVEGMTTVNDLQMFVREKYNRPKEEEPCGPYDIYNKNHEVTPVERTKVSSVSVLPQEQMFPHKVVEKHRGVEEMTERNSEMNSKATESQDVIAPEAEVCVDTELLTGQAERQIHCFAPLKPALPVNQECPKEFSPAPPFSEPAKVSLVDSSMATHNHLEAWLHPSAPHHSSREKTLPEDTTRSTYQTSTEIHHAEREEHTHNEKTDDLVTLFRRTQSSEGQEPISAEKISTTYTTEETFSHNQGEVCLIKVKTDTDNTRTFPHRDVVEVSKTTPEGRREAEDLRTAEEKAFQQHLIPTRFIPGDRFFHTSTVLSTVIEEPDSEIEGETDPGSDTDMSSAVAILNTKLSRPSSARQGREDVVVVRKVSLVSADRKSSSSDGLGFRDQPEPSTASPDLHRRWQSINSDSEEKPSRSFMEDSDYKLTQSSYLHSTQLSPSYEKAVYTSHFSSSGTQQAPPTSFFSETDGSLGNRSWKVTESEVHLGSESYISGRNGAELSTPVGAREGEREVRKTGFESQAHLETSLVIKEEGDESFSDVFKATRVELEPSPTDSEPQSLFASPYSEMDSLVDTLKSMDRPVRQRVQRTASNTPFSSLPPIEEDAPVSPFSTISPPTPISPLTLTSTISEPKKVSNGVSSLPPDLGLNWSSLKDMRSPLTLMKEQQSAENMSRGLSLPLRASALNSIVMRRSSLNDLSPEETSSKGLMNGGGGLGSSRLENSLFFQPPENGKLSNRSIFRAASLPDIGSGQDRISSAPKGTDSLLGSRYERFSFLKSSSSSLSGIGETSRISLPPSIQQNSSTETSSFNHKNTLELYRSLPSESLLKNSQTLGLQRSSSVDGALHHLPTDNKAFQMNPKPKPEPERNLALKYRAFPDAYLTKEKEHGKLNPRPGKMFIYDKPGMTGQRIEVRGDVVDATPWEFTGTISIRVIRGGWVLYEKPDFKGEKIALDEGDIELTNPFGPPEEEEIYQQNGTARAEDEEPETKPQKKKFAIGSIRRAVRDYSVPEIGFFPEENAEGKKVTFRDTSEDARIFGFPIKANSVIINAGLWLVFAEPFFQGVPRVLEVGGYPNPAAWGVTHPYVSSVHPLKIGEPRVENLFEPKIVMYEKPYFTGKSREIYSSIRDFMTRTDRKQSLFMYSAGSIKVIGGCWVGYEKEGFRGHQYLLEEGEYHDWRVWGGVNSELRSLRVIQSDLSEPMLVLYGQPEGEKEPEEEPTFEVTEAIADVELFGFGINTRSIDVLSGVWVAYSHVDFSGNQYVLEKGFYTGCGDWGSGDTRICSLQPILPAPSEEPSFRNEVLLYSEPDFQGSCSVCHKNTGLLPENLIVKSCRVVGGSWVLYEGERFTGNLYVLSEGNYPNLNSMGCPASCCIRSVKPVSMTLSVPSVSLFGLECFEGREVTVDTQIANMQEEGFNTHFLSVRVNSGCWVLCEHSNYRGRQFLLEPIEITNWHKFSSLSSVGSLYPVRQKQRPFRIRNKECGHYMSVQGGVEEMKTGRVVVTEEVEGMSDVWFYQDGLIKNKLARTMSLQVMGNVETGAKVVLWTETRMPVQMWSAQVSGKISSATFPGMVLDIKGGKSYDRQHLVIREESEDSEICASQQWELEFI